MDTAAGVTGEHLQTLADYCLGRDSFKCGWSPLAGDCASLLLEARRAKFSVDKEFEVGVDRGALSAAHATTLRGAAAAEALRESGDVPDGLLSKDALELRV